jgi:hypothetical protein
MIEGKSNPSDPIMTGDFLDPSRLPSTKLMVFIHNSLVLSSSVGNLLVSQSILAPWFPQYVIITSAKGMFWLQYRP